MCASREHGLDTPPEGLTTTHLGQCYIRLEETSSTNDYLRERVLSLPHGAAVTAQRQTAAKGRRGRAWNSPKGSGLALSVLLRRIGLEDMPRLPLICGVAVSRGLEDLTGCRCAIKWSNDVLLEEQKVCGILCESRIAGDSLTAVVGIGVNLLQTRESLTDSGLVYAASVYSVTGKTLSQDAVAARILNNLEEILLFYEKQGFTPVRELYKERCITLGRRVRVEHNGEHREAVAVDIGDNGSLLCRDDGGAVFSVNAGEASVRGLYGYV